MQNKVSLNNLILHWSTCYIQMRMARHGSTGYGSYYMLIIHIHCVPLATTFRYNIPFFSAAIAICTYYPLQRLKINIDRLNCTHIYDVIQLVVNLKNKRSLGGNFMVQKIKILCRYNIKVILSHACAWNWRLNNSRNTCTCHHFIHLMCGV